jgi:hypothetical protein
MFTVFMMTSVQGDYWVVIDLKKGNHFLGSLFTRHYLGFQYSLLLKGVIKELCEVLFQSLGVKHFEEV